MTHGNKAPKHTQKYTCYDTCLSKLMNLTQEVVTLTWGDTTVTPPLVDGVAMDTRRRGRRHTPGVTQHNVIFQKLIDSLANRSLCSCNDPLIISAFEFSGNNQDCYFWKKLVNHELIRCSASFTLIDFNIIRFSEICSWLEIT